ncbi:MAG: hypothetical protein AB1540_02305 [Bdellovibrionota bacterium]
MMHNALARSKTTTDKIKLSAHLCLIAIAFFLAAYTQLWHFTTVPGLHFDEAWQGLYAHRIATEANFWPASAMNSYTTPVVHYFLALVFKVFSPTLEAMRGFYAAINLVTLGLIAALIARFRGSLAATWFTGLWALLPLSIHNHRFYVELTGFHGFCFALLLWGLALWKTRPRIAIVLIGSSVMLGAYSHVLFIATYLAALVVLPMFFEKEFKSPRVRLTIALIAFFLVPLTLRMGIGLKKPLPFLLASVLFMLGFIVASASKLGLSRKIWDGWITHSKLFSKIAMLGAIPFLIAFVFLHWNGLWPYAQATGHLHKFWLPVNAILFLGLGLHSYRMRKKHDQSRLYWQFFLVNFFISSLLIFKQSPRYYMVSTLIAMAWVSIGLAQIKIRQAQAAIAVVFVAWNLFAFQKFYITQFEREGSTTLEFKLGPFHDNGRDFRPFQKVFAFMVEKNCQDNMRWVEDDRFLLPIEFLRLTAPPADPKGPQCPWPRENLFFSHIPNYDENFRGIRDDRNTPPPVANVKFLAHFLEWGDLALWMRR